MNPGDLDKRDCVFFWRRDANAGSGGDMWPRSSSKQKTHTQFCETLFQTTGDPDNEDLSVHGNERMSKLFGMKHWILRTAGGLC